MGKHVQVGEKANKVDTIFNFNMSSWPTKSFREAQDCFYGHYALREI